MSISLVLQFLFISLLSNLGHAYKQCMHDQKTSLLDLKNELSFDSIYSRKLVRWNETDNCCRWEGVECDDVGHVISLQLDHEGIYDGLLETSSTLFTLSYLKKLNLAWNYFYVAPIPRGIGNLTSLTHLNLSHAGFGGQIPMEISLLRRLVSLDVSDYSHSSDVRQLKLEHPDLGMVLRNLTGLEELYLDGVDISADNTEWYNIISSSLPNLRNLSLRDCSLSSPLDPSLSKFQSLTIVRLGGNNLSTVVPNFFVNFSSLTILNLYNCSLKGSLDLSNNFFLGPNSSMFARPLSNLVHLDLAYNSLSGNIPRFLFGLLSLQTLDLSNNQFSGRVADQVYFSNIKILHLDRNRLEGAIPESFFHLESMESLDLSNNQFGGQLHEFPNLNFSNIKVLDLSRNQLEGPIPESLFQLENIEVLFLSYNLFNDTFQLEKIQRLRNLRGMNLSYNKYLSVDASITNSSSVFTYPQLEYLQLASCNLHYFPDFLKQSSTLIDLDLSNNQIAGEVPSWIWEIGNGTFYSLNLSSNLLVDLQKPYNIPASLGVLDLHSNNLQGEFPLPPPQAQYVDYSNNNLDNPIPPNMGNFSSSIQFFSLKNNSISGSIPPSLCNILSLQVLDLSINKLTGGIPPCLLENMEYLVKLNLGRNNISGDIPDKFFVNCSLTSLELSDNNLTGDIPSSLASCKSLEVVNVGNNKINDTFPCMLSSSLRILVLRSNRFYGEVRCHKTWPNLQIIDIAFNNFSGNLHPISFSSWTGMMVDDVSDGQSGSSRLDIKFLTSSDYYQNEVTLTIKGLELKLVKIWSYFTSIDFSGNNFKGEIPEAIGDLTSLYLLNLSHNALTRAIPKSLGKLRDLGSLDLSENQLTGMIPMELAKLTFLSVLNLSYNKLVGEIPIGPQLQTFSSDSFKGNRGLCGKPSNISCKNSTNASSSPTIVGNMEPVHEKMEIEWEYVSVVLGYVVGLGSFTWVFLGCISLRDIYFDKIDEILEKISIRNKKRRRDRRRVGRNQVRRR